MSTYVHIYGSSKQQQRLFLCILFLLCLGCAGKRGHRFPSLPGQQGAGTVVKSAGVKSVFYENFILWSQSTSDWLKTSRGSSFSGSHKGVPSGRTLRDAGTIDQVLVVASHSLHSSSRPCGLRVRGTGGRVFRKAPSRGLWAHRRGGWHVIGTLGLRGIDSRLIFFVILGNKTVF